MNTGFAVGSNGAILQTFTGGQNWAFNSIPQSAAPAYNDLFIIGNRGWIAGNSGFTSNNTDIADISGNGSVWNSTTPLTINLNRVSFPGTRTVQIAGANGILLKTVDGSHWTQEPSSTTQQIDDLFFVDQREGFEATPNGAIETNDGGASWSPPSLIFHWSTPLSLHKIFFTDPDHGWAVGDGGAVLSYVTHRSSVTDDSGDVINSSFGVSQQVNPANLNFYGVFFTSSSEGWVVGAGGAIYHSLDGGITFTAQTSGTNASLFAVAFTDSNHGVVVGDNGTILVTEDRGTTWKAPTSVPPSASSASLKAVHFFNAETGWIVGSGGTILKTTDRGVTWTSQNPPTNSDLNGIDFSGASIGWVVGAGGTVLSTQDGGATWTPQIIAYTLTDGTSTTLSSDLRTVAVTQPNTAYAAANSGTLFLTSNGGFSWFSESAQTSSPLLGVFFTDSAHGWLVGSGSQSISGSTILRTDNGAQSWNAITSGFIGNTLNQVFFANSDIGWIVGSGGLILKTSNGSQEFNPAATPPGPTFTRLAQGLTTSDLNNLYFIDACQGWVVGNGGTILHTYSGGESGFPNTPVNCQTLYSGQTPGWFAQNSGVNNNTFLSGVSFIDQLHGWVVGEAGTILHTKDGGTTWVTQNSNTNNDLFAVQMLDAKRGFIAGASGTILKTTTGGDTWTPLITHTSSDLHDLFFGNPETGLAIGANGIILTTRTGGE